MKTNKEVLDDNNQYKFDAKYIMYDKEVEIDQKMEELFMLEQKHQCDLLLPADVEKRMKEIQLEIAGLLGVQLEETLKSRVEKDV